MKYQEINKIQRKFNAIHEWRKRKLSWSFLFYRIRWNVVARFDYVTKFPLHLDIELTESCNLKCIMCVHGITGVPNTGFMDVEFAKMIIDQAARSGTKSIKLNWRGESGLHKGLEDLIRYAKQAGILEVQFNTNGIPFTRNRIEKIIESGLDRVIFSMDGASKTSYEKIRVGAKFEKLTENIFLFYELREKMGRAKPFIRFQMVKQKDNAHEVDQFLSEWSGVADDIAVKDVTDRGQGGELFVGDQKTVGRKRCNQPWQRMIVARDGKVFPCCSDWNQTYQIGDANSTSLKEIWLGEKMEDLRNVNRRETLDNVDPCRDCFVMTSYKWQKIKHDSRDSNKQHLT